MGTRAAAGADGPRDHVRLRIGTVLVSVAVLAALAMVSLSPAAVESVYVAHVGPAVVRTLSLVSGLAPVSLAEVVVVSFALWWLAPLLHALWQIARRARGPRSVAREHGLRTAALWLPVLAVFYLSWGLSYARADLVLRQGWTGHAIALDEPADSLAELERLSALLVGATNESYELAHGSTDLGTASGRDLDVARIDAAIDRGYERVARVLDQPGSFAASRGSAKPVMGSVGMSHMGVVGFYFPWTGEANYNRLIPRYQIPHGIAHEKAHQRLVASEDEANFIGYLASIASDDPYVRYSGYLFAQRQLVSEVWQLEPDRAAELLAGRHSGVQRDVDAGRAFWRQYEGPARTAHRELNDAYLTIHGVEGGIASYGLSARLIVVFARVNGGSPLIAGPAASH